MKESIDVDQTSNLSVSYMPTGYFSRKIYTRPFMFGNIDPDKMSNELAEDIKFNLRPKTVNVLVYTVPAYVDRVFTFKQDEAHKTLAFTAQAGVEERIGQNAKVKNLIAENKVLKVYKTKAENRGPERVVVVQTAKKSTKSHTTQALKSTANKSQKPQALVNDDAPSEKVDAQVLYEEYFVDLPGEFVRAKKALGDKYWVVECADKKLYLVNLEEVKKENEPIPLISEQWTAGGKYALFASSITRDFTVVELTSGKIIKKCDWDFNGEVSSFIMGSHNSRYVFVAVRKDSHIMFWHLYDLKNGKTFRHGESSGYTRSGGPNLFASKDLKTVGYTNISVSPTGINTIDPFNDSKVQNIHSSTNYIHFEGDERGFIARNTVYKRGSSRSRDDGVSLTSNTEAFLPDENGACNIRISTIGDCKLYLNNYFKDSNETKEFCSLGRLPWVANTGRRHQSLFVSIHTARKNDSKDSKKFKGYESLLSRMVFDSELGFFAFKNEFKKDGVTIRKFNLKDMMSSEISNEYLVLQSELKTKLYTGNSYEQQLKLLGKGGVEVKLLKGPSGFSISSDGLIKWDVPGSLSSVGKTRVALEFKNGAGEVKQIGYDIDVLPKVDSLNATAVESDDSQEHAPIYKFIFEGENSCNFTVLSNGLVAIQNNLTLSVVNLSSNTLIKKIPLKHKYNDLLACGDKIAAWVNGQLDIIDYRSLKPVRSFKIGGYDLKDGAFDKVNKRIWFASLKGGEDDRISQQKIIYFDFVKGVFRFYDNILGSKVAVHPSGKILYSYVKVSHMQRELLRDYFGGQYVRTISSNDQTLFAFAIKKDDSLDGLRLNSSPGSNAKDLVVDPFGRGVYYVSGGGYRSGPKEMNGYTIPLFDPTDVSKAVTSYNTGSYPSGVAVDLSTGVVATYNGKKITLHNSKTGIQITKEIKLSLGDQIQKMLFSKDGQHLYILAKNTSLSRQSGVSQKGDLFTVLDLSGLSAAMVKHQNTLVTKLPATSVIVSQIKKNLSVQTSLIPKSTLRISQEEINKIKVDSVSSKSRTLQKASLIAKKYNQATVLIKNNRGSGTGFFINKRGLILTCAHVLSQENTVRFKDSKGDVKTVKVAIVGTDSVNDLALLQTVPYISSPYVGLELKRMPEMGEQLVVIGNPGAGNLILSNTMTTGIVSNNNRILDGKKYIQTSAAINPGNSGGPIFDKYGNVCGVVTMKARMEGAGFAVPPDTMLKFLKAALKKK
ncbi:serine protease [Lentisphaera profundi]|uniref:Serine protease n=1 Tax=Lentisphaera profundi TaxID=1658616 RepID=A0ABY7VUZ5_9BACT|nr:serine protease [Lentisphaera profundi]WDE97892.1 serine protease [Lentisphaera profundi]